MTAHTAVATFTGTTYGVSAAVPATYDQAGYAATTMVYATIGKVQDFPAYGAKRAVNKFMPINGPIEKTKGSPDYGSGNLVVADVPADAGQVILAAADPAATHVSIKVTYADGEVHYLDALIAGWEMSAGKEGVPMLRTAMCEICKPPVIVAAP